VSTAGISLPLQFQQIVAVHQFPLSVNGGKPIAATNHSTGFQREMGKIISYKSKWTFRYQFFATAAPLNWISNIFWLKPLKPVFCDLKSKFPLILK
jgi:hypothetical protein